MAKKFLTDIDLSGNNLLNPNNLYTKTQADARYVVQTTTVNGHALSSNVTITASDVGLGNLTTDVQTKASVVPNTLPAAGQTLVGNAGGTAYAPVTISGDGTLASTGALTVTKSGGVTFGTGAFATIANYVPTSTTVNGHALTGNVTVTASDVSLGNVTNDAQVKRSEMGVANGVATLDATNHIPLSQLPSTIQGAMNYQGTWNASTNSPTLVSGVGTKGYYYKVSVTGATTIDTISQWNTGDLIAFDGTTWDKIDGLASEVLSVAGRTGAVVIAESDVTNLVTDLAGKVATTTTVNGHALSSNVVVSASDITTGTLPHAQLPTLVSGDIPNNAANTSGTATYANTITGGSANQILYQSAINSTSYAAALNNAVLTSGATGIPQMSTTLPTGLNIPNMLESVATGISAAGTTQGTATTVSSDVTVVSTVAATSGVVLSAKGVGSFITIVNKGANPLNVYPASGAAIDALAANAPIVLPVNSWIMLTAVSATQLYSTVNMLQSSTYLSGTVAIANGGTGATTQAAAITALTGAQTSGRYLRSDGTNSALAAIVAADVPVLNQNTTGTSGGLTGTPAITVSTVSCTTATGTSFNSITGLSSTTPLMNGTAAIGSATTVAKADHVHPSDTSKVSTTVTVNGHALSANVTVTASDVGLPNVTNSAQTLASVVPNTLPTAGQLLVGNAGGTAYAPVTLSGPVSISSTGVTSVATLNQNTTGYAADVAGGAANQILYQTGASLTGYISAVNNAVLVSNGTGVPSMSTTLPAVNGSALTGLTVAQVSGAVKKYSANIGNGTLTTIPVTHGLAVANMLDIVVSVYEIATNSLVEADVTPTDVNTVNIVFTVAPTTNQYRVVVIG